MKFFKRFICVVMSILILFSCFPQTAYADGGKNSLSSAKVVNMVTKLSCTGLPIGVYKYDQVSRSVCLDKEATLAKLATNSGSVSLITKDKTLIPEDAYDLTLSGDTGKKGTVTLTFTGIEEKGTSGKLVKKIKVVSRKLSKEEITVEFAEGIDPDDVPYSKTGAKPALTVHFTALEKGEKGAVQLLKEGVDYSVVYSNNKKVGAQATVSIKGKGRFTGKLSKVLSFVVGKADLDSDFISVTSADKKYKAKAKKGYFKSAPVLYDNGKKLKYGKDYTYAEGGEPQYTFVNACEIEDVEYWPGEEIPEDAILSANTDICVSFRVVPLGNSNYRLPFGEDSVECTAFYRIGQISVSDAKVVIEDQIYKGEGFYVTPGKSAVKSIRVKKNVLTYQDFEILSFSNNNRIGKATMVIHGIGNYYGTKKCTFKIVKGKSDGSIPIASAADLSESVEVTEDEETGEKTNPETVIGTVADNGFSLTVGEGALNEETKITFTSLSEEKLASIGALDQTAEMIISPVDIELDGYDGTFFGDGDFVLTLPITDMEDPAAYVFCCYDEWLGEIRYLYPESYDLTNGTISISLPHLSLWWSKKMTKEEKIEAFLNEYSTKLAVEKGGYKQAASAMEPYMKQKIAALGLTKKAAADLLQFSLVRWASSFDGSSSGGMYEYNAKVATGMTRAIYEGDSDAILMCLTDSADEALKQSWDLMEYSQRLSEKMDPEIFNGATGAAIGNANALTRMIAYFTEGGDDNYKAGMEELGNILQGVNPVVEKVTKITAFVGSCLNLGFTYWKADKIEELYKVYRDGLDSKWFGNYVKAGDRDSFLDYIYCANGLTASKGIARFYNMDKLTERIIELGWDKQHHTTDYYKLPAENQKILADYAIDTLLDYFKTRMAQEKEAQKIKESEREVIQTMMGFGILDPGKYQNFFGEIDKDDYDIQNRLERLARVRSAISMYVNEKRLDELRRCNSYNYGDVLNYWVMYISDKNETRETAIEKFKATLDEWGVLNENFRVKKAVTGIKLNKRSVTLEKGGKVTLKATVYPADAYDTTVIWSENIERQVELIWSQKEGQDSHKCDVKGHESGTTTVVTATTRDGGFTAKCVIKVRKTWAGDALELDFEQEELSMNVGETHNFKVLSGELGDVKSSDTKVATVSRTGITAQAEGVADITFKDRNYPDDDYVVRVYVGTPDDHLYFGIYDGWLSYQYSATVAGAQEEEFSKDEAKIAYSSVYITYGNFGDMEYVASMQINTRTAKVMQEDGTITGGGYYSREYCVNPSEIGADGDLKLYRYESRMVMDEEGLPVYDDEGLPVWEDFYDPNNFVIASGIYPTSFTLYSITGELDEETSKPKGVYVVQYYTFDLTGYESMPPDPLDLLEYGDDLELDIQEAEPEGIILKEEEPFEGEIELKQAFEEQNIYFEE